jgi:uncharacterized Fe-S cluster-containing protein
MVIYLHYNLHDIIHWICLATPVSEYNEIIDNQQGNVVVH